MQFKKAELSDAQALACAFENYKGRICDYSMGNAIFWRDYYGISFYIGEDGAILRFDNMGDTVCYSYPISNDPFALIDKLLRENDGEICLSCLTREEYEAVSKSYSISNVIHDVDWDDYLYAAEEMTSLNGRKYNGQRNHINKFRKCYPDARFDLITAENAHIAKEFCHRYFGGFGKVTDVSDVEYRQLCEQFDNWEAYRQLGGMLFVDNEAVGISVGEQVGDTLIIHTEKANTAFEGVYPMLTNSFARHFAEGYPSCKFINREEDCGDEGLRRAKLSYHPIEIIEKYAVVVREGRKPFEKA